MASLKWCVAEGRALVASVFAEHGASAQVLCQGLAASAPIDFVFKLFWHSVPAVTLNDEALHCPASWSSALQVFGQRRGLVLCFGLAAWFVKPSDAGSVDAVRFKGAQAAMRRLAFRARARLLRTIHRPMGARFRVHETFCWWQEPIA